MNTLIIIEPTFVPLLLPEMEFLSFGLIRLEEAYDQSLKQICTHTNIDGFFEFHTLEFSIYPQLFSALDRVQEVNAIGCSYPSGNT